MTRTLTLTPTEWEVLQRDGTAWIVRPPAVQYVREVHGEAGPLLPAELVGAAAPCDGETVTCHCGCDVSCPDCRIALLGECPRCPGTVILGCAYADSEVLPCVDDPDSVGEAACIHVESAHVAWHWKAGEPDEYAETDISAELAHYGDLRDLVGRYALKVRLA